MDNYVKKLFVGLLLVAGVVNGSVVPEVPANLHWDVPFMSESYCDAVFRARVGSAIAEAASAISQFLGCDQAKTEVIKTDRKINRPTEGVNDNVIVHQPMGSSEENHSSSVEEVKNTAGTRDYKKLGRHQKRVRFHSSVTVVLVEYKEDGVSVVSQVSSQLLKDGADADTGHTPYRTSSHERLHPISKYLCFGK